MTRLHSLAPPAAALALLVACGCNGESDAGTGPDCQSAVAVDTTRGACSETLSWTPLFSMIVSGDTRTITTNSIPDHEVGLFGMVPGALNPNPIREQNNVYTITTTPAPAATVTPLQSSNGPEYSFGVMLNGVELDPVAAEPWPHRGIMDPDVNWEWNLEASRVSIGLDCNNAHVQPSGKYHYHGDPTLYLDGLTIDPGTMTLVGYAADGYPVYYRYGYTDPDDDASGTKELLSSYRRRDGVRPGDGVSAPCGAYDGTYTADYEYVAGLGDLDECNGRTGVTPEYPGGTYYYVLTRTFPIIPRCFRGTPSGSFHIGP